MTQRINGYWVLAALVCFFGIIMLANVVLVKLANGTWTGLITEQAYEKGIAYNDTLTQRAEEEALGWDVTVHLSQETAQSGTLTLTVVDAAGQPVAAEGTVLMQRPTLAGHDFTVPLTAKEPGTLMTKLEVPLPGQWLAVVTLTRDNDSLTAQHRLYFN